jgi:hypothetical protein
MINKKIINLMNKHHRDIDGLEDLYSDISREADVIREFIDLIYNYRTNPDSKYTETSFEYFNDDDTIKELEHVLQFLLVEN